MAPVIHRALPVVTMHRGTYVGRHDSSCGLHEQRKLLFIRECGVDDVHVAA